MQQGLGDDTDFKNLPPELVFLIVSHIPPEFLQRTATSLNWILPDGIQEKWLWEHVCIRRESSIADMEERMWQIEADEGVDGKLKRREWIKSWMTQIWKVDSHRLINLITPLANLQTVNLLIGPTFSPESLEELLLKPKWITKVEQLSFRFNPYVSRRSYYQFLKGAYFDSAVETLSKWPAGLRLNQISIVQDPLPSLLSSNDDGLPIGFQSQTGGVAQPIVFFRLICISQLSLSPLSKSITHLRLRIPQRSLTTYLTSPSTSSTVNPPRILLSPKAFQPFPLLQHLDLSTSLLVQPLVGNLAPLLKRYTDTLTSLCLDYVDAFGGSLLSMPEGEEGKDFWSSKQESVRNLGELCASIGIFRSKDAKKTWVRWREAAVTANNRAATAAANAQAATQGRAPEREHVPLGPENVEPIPAPISRRSRRSRNPGMPRWTTETQPARNTNTTASASTSVEPAQSTQDTSLPERLIILASPPTLTAIGIGIDWPNEGQRAILHKSFQDGWKKGMAKFKTDTEEKLDSWRRHSARAYVPLIRFSRPQAVSEEEKLERRFRTSDIQDRPHRLPDFLEEFQLEEIRSLDAHDAMTTALERQCVICTIPDCSSAGIVPSEENTATSEICEWRSGHPNGCAHRISRRIWGDA